MWSIFINQVVDMSELTAGADARQSATASFFLWMTIAMAAIIFGGFGTSYFQPMIAGSLPPMQPVVHLHGFFYFGWFALLVIQPWLVKQNNVALHRKLGLLGISMGTGVVILGSIVTIIFTRRLAGESDTTVYGLMYISQLAVLGFAVLFFLALKNIHNPVAHKRFILLATLTLVIGGLNRIFGAFDYGVESNIAYLPRYLSVDLFVIALLIYDWRTLGKIHPATIIGASVNVVPQILHAPIVDSATFVELTHWLGNLSA